MLVRRLGLLAAVLASGWAWAQPKGVPGPKPLPPRPDAFSIVERFERMTPQQRKRFLDNLPPERKKLFQDRLRRYERLTPEQRQQVRDQYELFQDLPKERQDALRKSFRQFNELAPERRRILRREILLLRQLPEAERQALLSREPFRSRHSAEELHLLGEFARLLPQPKPPAAQEAPSK